MGLTSNFCDLSTDKVGQLIDYGKTFGARNKIEHASTEGIADNFRLVFRGWVAFVRDDPAHTDPKNVVSDQERCSNLHGMLKATSALIELSNELKTRDPSTVIACMARQDEIFATKDELCSVRKLMEQDKPDMALSLKEQLARLPTLLSVYETLSKGNLPRQIEDRLGFAAKYFGLEEGVSQVLERLKSTMQLAAETARSQHSIGPVQTPSIPNLPAKKDHAQAACSSPI